jgi:diguanylate cyclase (GGDEF)-like protein/PAS domain S-box-containing protein
MPSLDWLPRRRTALSGFLCMAAAGAYVAAFVPLHPILGEITGALAVLPVGLVGWLHGMRLSLVAGVLSLAVNVALYGTVGDGGTMVPSGLTAGAVSATAGVAIGRRRDLAVSDGAAAGSLRAARPLPVDGSATPAAAARSTEGDDAAARIGLGAVPAMSCVSRPSDDVVLEVNEALLRGLGLTRDAAIGRTVVEVGLWSDSRAWAAVRGQLRRHGSAEGIEFTARRSNGQERALVGSVSVVTIGSEAHVVHCAVPVTRARPVVERTTTAPVAAQAGTRGEPSLRLDPALLLVSRLDDDVVVEASQNFLALVGLRREEIVGQPAQELGPLADAQRREIVLEMLRRHGSVRNVEFQVQDRAGATRDLLASVALAEVNGAQCIVTSALDVTERVRRERFLAQRALSDEVTGVASAAALRDQLERAIADAGRSGGSAALVLVELDGVDEVAVAFGPSVRDEMLRQAGSRLSATVRPGDTVARAGPARFAVALPGCDAANAKQAARAFLSALRPPAAVAETSVGFNAIVGIAAFPVHADSGSTLQQRAESALGIARQTGSSLVEYSAAEDRRPPTDPTLTAELSAAIAGGRLVLEYQPELEVKTGRVAAWEALVRWPHPTRGMLGPAQFLPVAERAGLMRPLTRWVLGQALAHCREWRASGLDVRVAVNLSSRDLADPDVVDAVTEALRATSLSPSALLLDIPEGALAADPRRTAPVVERLRRTGVVLALDDAGTAYSPLGQLNRFGFRQVKVAAVFVSAMHRTPAHAAFVRATIDACHAFGCEVLAEGVEEEETLRLLREMNCDLVQGYLFAQPMPADAVPGWMARLGGSELAGLRQRLSQGSRSRLG